MSSDSHRRLSRHLGLEDSEVGSASMEEADSWPADAVATLGSAEFFGEEHLTEKQIRNVVFGRRTDPDDLQHLFACRDCRFRAAVLVARAPRSGAGRWIRSAAALIILLGLGLTWIHTHETRVASPPAPIVVSTDPSVELGSYRAGATELQLSPEVLDGKRLILQMQAPLPPEGGHWTLQDRRTGAILCEGDITGSATDGGWNDITAILSDPRSRLVPGGKYTWMLAARDGREIARWRFTVGN